MVCLVEGSIIVTEQMGPKGSVCPRALPRRAQGNWGSAGGAETMSQILRSAIDSISSSGFFSSAQGMACFSADPVFWSSVLWTVRRGRGRAYYE